MLFKQLQLRPYVALSHILADIMLVATAIVTLLKYTEPQPTVNQVTYNVLEMKHSDSSYLIEFYK